MIQILREVFKGIEDSKIRLTVLSIVYDLTSDQECLWKMKEQRYEVMLTEYLDAERRTITKKKADQASEEIKIVLMKLLAALIREPEEKVIKVCRYLFE